MTQFIRHNGHNIVDGVLQLEDLNVSGCLDIHGCAALTALPEGLTGVRFLDLSGCTALTTLPHGLDISGTLNLSGCTALSELPDWLAVDEYLDLRGCTALTALPPNLCAAGDTDLSGCTAICSAATAGRAASYILEHVRRAGSCLTAGPSPSRVRPGLMRAVLTVHTIAGVSRHCPRHRKY